MTERPEAYVTRNAAGELVLVDAVAAGVIAAVEAHNRRIALTQCRTLHILNLDVVARFARRMVERELTPAEVVIVLIVVDDPNGGPIVAELMPGHDWSAIRATGAQPIARGLAERGGIQDALRFDPEAHAALAASAPDKPAVVVISDGVAAVYRHG